MEEEGENSPGPPADSNYIQHLCHCMEEAQKVCEWLIGQTVMLRVLRHINHNTPSIENTETKEKIKDGEGEQRPVQVSKQQILSFLVNGAIFLRSMLVCYPHGVATKQPQPQQKRGRGRPAKGGQKRRRSVVSTSCKNSQIALGEQAFADIAKKALVSNTHLEKMLDQLLPAKRQQTSNQVLITAFLTLSLTTLFKKLWTPLAQWIHTSEDMINRTAKKFTASQFYTVEPDLPLT